MKCRPGGFPEKSVRLFRAGTAGKRREYLFSAVPDFLKIADIFTTDRMTVRH